MSARAARQTETYRELVRQRWQARRDARSFTGDSDSARLDRSFAWKHYFVLGYRMRDLLDSFARETVPA